MKKLKIIKKVSIVLTAASLLTGVSIFTFIFTGINRELYPFSEKLTQFSDRLKFVIIKLKNERDFKNLLSKELLYDDKFIRSGWHNINKKIINAENYLYNYKSEETAGLPGGYISVVDKNNIIGANGKGEMFLLNIDNQKFSKVKTNLNDIYNQQNYKGKIIPRLFGRFGLRDIYLDKTKENLYTSLFIDINKKGCYGMAIYKAKIHNKKFNELSFKKFFQTINCNENFNGHASGGRIKELNEKIIFTVGSYDMNLHGDKSIPQSPNTAIGKVIEIDKNGNYSVLSLGHRNQQGLEIVNGKIFITEHGPMGGDEINEIKQGYHYGWPYYAYGFDYDYREKFRFPHEGIYQKPSYYFTPSLGISELKFYKGSEFQRWNNKFLVTSLKYQSIYLLDYDPDENRFISSERINIGHRIRDISSTEDGRIILITDDQKIVILSKSENDAVSSDTKKIDF